MSKLNEIATKLLQSGDVQCIVGYAEGSNGRVRPAFVRNEDEVSRLIYDERCTQNLAMYLYKKEIASLGKPAIVANTNTLRGIIRLAAEKQLKENSLIALAMKADGEIAEFRTFEEIEDYLSTLAYKLNDKDQILLDKISAMSSDDRWTFWKNEMENCIKCYACRQACPLCYCTQCTVESNQPQWIPVAASTEGNLEWHIMRAMHLSGRCVSCGQCAEACPVNIPIHLLPIKLSEEIREAYGMLSGTNRNEGCAMATFQPNDKEDFIG